MSELVLVLSLVAILLAVIQHRRYAKRYIPPPIVQEVVSLQAVKDLLHSISKQHADTLVRLQSLYERFCLLESANESLLSLLRSKDRPEKVLFKTQPLKPPRKRG